ncbi:MAG: hypothetical protein WD065_09975 [Planctomycetaceae bacterium]
MSFEVFIQRIDEHGETIPVARDKIRPFFPVVEDKSESDFWHIRYGESYCHVNLHVRKNDPQLIDRIVVWRPCDDEKLWEAIYNLMSQEKMLMYYPGCEGPLVAVQNAAVPLPADMIAALGPPVLVASGRDITRAITGR